ncbi:hypothetical protein ACEU6E_07240 [Halorutilales archaeon Cl-col2-1]
MSISIRDATEEDAERIAEIASEDVLDESLSVDSVKDMVHDRSIKVAETKVEAEDEDEDKDESKDEVIGYVSYEVRPDTESVVIHHLGVGDGEDDTLRVLLDEPLEVADDEDAPVRVAVAESGASLREALEERGFEVVEMRRFSGENLLVYEFTP